MAMASRSLIAYALATMMYATFLVISDATVGVQLVISAVPVLGLIGLIQVVLVTLVFTIVDPLSRWRRSARACLATVVALAPAMAVIWYLSINVDSPAGYEVPVTVNVIFGSIPAGLAGLLFGLWRADDGYANESSNEPALSPSSAGFPPDTASTAQAQGSRRRPPGP